MYLPSAQKFRSSDAVRSSRSLPMRSIPLFCLCSLGLSPFGRGGLFCGLPPQRAGPNSAGNRWTPCVPSEKY